jgi:hypothetical protein
LNKKTEDEALLKVLHDLDVEMLSISPDDDRLRRFAATRHPDLMRYMHERNAALYSGDEARIRAVCRDWAEFELPEHPEVFRGTVHRAITAIPILPPPFREQSKRWLEERGLRPEGDA